MAWTKEQQAAIDSRQQTLLLSAAAGSGKTAVLVERIIRRLLDAKQPLDITEMLVVTFTKAAAAEMRERIAAALAKELASGNTVMAERQLALMPSAHISTLHSFCQFVIKRYFYRINIDPSFTVAGQEELILLQHRVLEELFLQYYEDEQKAQVLYPLAEMFGDEHGDEALMDEIIRLYTFSRSSPWPDYWLEQSAANYDLGPQTTIDDLPWCQPIMSYVKVQLASCIRRLHEAIDSLAFSVRLDTGREQMEAECQMLQNAYDQETWLGLRLAMKAIQFTRIVSLRKLEAPEKDRWDYCKDIVRKEVKNQVNTLVETFFAGTDEAWLASLRALQPYVKGLVQVTCDFAAAYGAAKKEKGWVDFNDLEHLCLQILRDPASTPDHVIPSAAAEELRQTFQEVLMDEYQDTNGVQEMIAQLVSRENNRFMVGDIKQSIYRFRLADPTLFLSKYQAYSRDPAAVQRCIDLARNFRSDETVLAAVNELFENVMTETSAGMTYGEREKLYPGRPPCTDERWLGGTVEVHLLDRDSTDFADELRRANSDEAALKENVEMTNLEKEGWLIAQRLRALYDSGRCVQRKDGTLEPLSWRHMVILLRSVKDKAQVLSQVLQAAGIPVYADENGGYFAAIEVQVMLSLLRCIDNPEQDLPMAAVLRSPLVGLDETELSALRLAGPSTLWQNLPAYIEGLADSERAAILQAFCQSLETWRTFSRRNSVAKLLYQIYQDTGYLHFVGGMPGGAVREANLKALYERARQYEAAGYRGLFRYLQLIDQMQDDEIDLAPAKVLGEGEDVVRILSIHKSKGLEFPVVVIADMGKQFNERDLSRDILLHQTLGIGLRQFDSEWRISTPTFIWNGLKAQLGWEGRAEEQRILYVAMTRARDKLIMVGSVNHLETTWEHWQQHLDPAQGRTYLDWLMPLFAGQDEWQEMDKSVLNGLDGTWRRGLWQVTLHRSVTPQAVAERESETDSLLASVQAGKPTGIAWPAWFDKTLSWQYDYPQATHTAAKYSVSEIKEQYQRRLFTELAEAEELAAPGAGTEPQDDDVFAELPPWLQEEEDQVTGARRGTAMHKAMQHLQLQHVLTLEDLQQQVQQWQEQGFFTAEEAKLLRLPELLSFCQSPLGQRMAASPQVHREYPFSVLLPARGLLADAEAGEEILVQGIIDCLFKEGDAWVLVDYKTDHLETEEAFRQRYAIQLDIYKAATEQISHCPVKETYIYSLHLGKSISLT